MDACVDGEPVTPRRGKPVEVEALWFNALRTMEELAGRFGEAAAAARFGAMAAQARESFLRLFPDERGGGLYDVVDGGTRDPSIRPNQLFAVSLPHSMLDEEKARGVLAVVTRDLLTPLRPPDALSEGPALRRAVRRGRRGARPRLPPGDRLAVASRPLRGRPPPGEGGLAPDARGSARAPPAAARLPPRGGGRPAPGALRRRPAPPSGRLSGAGVERRRDPARPRPRLALSRAKRPAVSRHIRPIETEIQSQQERRRRTT